MLHHMHHTEYSHLTAHSIPIYPTLGIGVMPYQNCIYVSQSYLNNLSTKTQSQSHLQPRNKSTVPEYVWARWHAAVAMYSTAV